MNSFSFAGACTILTENSEIVVNFAEDDNPAGLKAGDQILGYDGEGWENLLKEIESWDDFEYQTSTDISWGRVEGTNIGSYLELDLEAITWYSIPADENTFYDKPIAVLQGPKSVSGGDIFSYFVKHHPRARRFGRVTNGSFGSPRSVFDKDPILEDISFRYTNLICLDEQMNHLQGLEQNPEESIWLDKIDIANGIDTVVQKAVDWIEGQLSVNSQLMRI